MIDIQMKNTLNRVRLKARSVWILLIVLSISPCLKATTFEMKDMGGAFVVFPVPRGPNSSVYTESVWAIKPLSILADGRPIHGKQVDPSFYTSAKQSVTQNTDYKLLISGLDMLLFVGNVVNEIPEFLLYTIPDHYEVIIINFKVRYPDGSYSKELTVSIKAQ